MFKRLIVLFAVLLFAQEPITPIPQKIEYNKNKALLGKILFFDPILSLDDKISCASCHSPLYGGADYKQFSIGVYGQIDTPMNSPTVFNAVFNCWQFWNGRAKNLKQQAMMANMNKKEMAMTPEILERKINRNKKYKKMFYQVYKKKYITYDMVMDAIAEFEKALITPNSKFDKYLRGDKNALNTLEKRGYFLFKAYGCITCHNGVNLGGNTFQKLGVIQIDTTIPRGNDRFYVTKRQDDIYVYKVPGLRNVAITAPYFHNGSVSTLKEAIRKMAIFNLGVDLTPSEIKAIEAFLRTLTGEMPSILKSTK
jgi:cytochrome c peroxidase